MRAELEEAASVTPKVTDDGVPLRVAGMINCCNGHKSFQFGNLAVVRREGLSDSGATR